MGTYVAKFAESVQEHAKSVIEHKRAQRWTNVLNGIKQAIADTGDETFLIGESLLDGADVDSTLEVLQSLVREQQAETGAMATQAQMVQGWVNSDVLEEEDNESAKAALALWAQVRPVVTKGRSGSNGTSAAKDLIDGQINAKCDLCDYLQEAGKTSGHVDWNTMRHECRKHAIDAHGAIGFQGAVGNAWLRARQAFVEGALEQNVEGDINTPSFTLRKVS